MQYFITSAPALGFDQVWRAGRPWPKTGLLVEVMDQEEDPPPGPDGGPRLIGKKTWQALKADQRIFARPAGDVEEIAAASVALVEAREIISKQAERITELEAEVAKLRGQAPEAPPPSAPPAETTQDTGKGGRSKKG